VIDRRLIRVSKLLALILRHRPQAVGVRLDPAGWIGVDTLLGALAAHGHAVSRADLDAVVAGNDKQRFAVRVDGAGVAYIRASQGHSATVGVDLGLEPATPPGRLYHGTAAANGASIRRDGLIKGSRQHVHLSSDIDTARVVGRRHGTQVAIFEVDAAAMVAAGLEFYRSDNGVWLADAVPAAYLSEMGAVERS
jgi:putative RNA 2'-phosphotransferase